MNGFEAALLAFVVLVTVLLIITLGCIDSLRDELALERAIRATREAADKIEKRNK